MLTSARPWEMLPPDPGQPPRALRGFPDDLQRAHSLPRPAGPQRVEGVGGVLRSRAGLPSPGSRPPRGVREGRGAAGTPPPPPHRRSLVAPWGGGSSGRSWRGGGVAEGGGAGGTFSPSLLEGASRIGGSPRLREAGSRGLFQGALAAGCGECAAGLGTVGIRTALAGSPGGGRERVAGNPGSAVFLARIEREGPGTGADAPTSIGSPFPGWGVAEAVGHCWENAASYPGLDGAKGMNPGPANTRVKEISDDSLADQEGVIFRSCMCVFCVCLVPWRWSVCLGDILVRRLDT